MLRNRPLVSTIVLSYNRKDEIITCLNSVCAQDYTPLEIVVLDNGSIDDSVAAILEEFPHVRLIRMPRNYGDWQGRDIALHNCRGKYVVCIDNDAVMPVDAISMFIKRMESEPELAVVEGLVIDPVTKVPFSCAPEVAGINHYRANFLGGAAAYRKRALLQVGGFPHYLLGGGEAHLTLRFLDQGYRILHLADCIVHHDMSPKERIPHIRFFLSSKQRLCANMAHYPGMWRPLADLIWKLIYYSLEGKRRGFGWRIPRDLVALFVAGVASWCKEDRRVKWETVNLIDYLHTSVVRTLTEYEAIDISRSYMYERILARFGLKAK